MGDLESIAVTAITSVVTLILGYLGHKYQHSSKKVSSEQEVYLNELDAGAKHRDKLMDRNDMLQKELDDLREQFLRVRLDLATERSAKNITEFQLQTLQESYPKTPAQTAVYVKTSAKVPEAHLLTEATDQSHPGPSRGDGT